MRLLRCLLVNLWLCVVVAASLGRVRFSAPYASEFLPSIRTRGGRGRVRLGRMKSRWGLRLFADGGQISIADGVFFNNGCSINSRAGVTVGEGTLLGENVRIYDHNHLFDLEHGVHANEFAEAEVVIGNRCWIGSNVVILKGVVICDHVAVAAGSVVRQSIAERGIYANGANGSMVLIGRAVA